MGRRTSVSLVAVSVGTAVVITALTAGYMFLPTREVVAVSTRDGTITHLVPEQSPIRISYIHSIDRLPIEEELVVVNGELVVERTRVRQFGAGMGYASTDGLGYADGPWWVVDGMDRVIGPELLIRAGPAGVDHELEAGSTRLDLTGCWPGEQIRIAPERVSRAQLWFASDPSDGCTQ